MSHKIKGIRYFQVGPFYYRFKLGLTIITILAMLLLINLCIWQIQRYYEKKTMLLQLQKKSEGIPIRLATIDNPRLYTHRFTPVLIQGTYLNNFTFLLDNQVYKKQVGFRILTVFQSPYLNKWILIDRGWIARTKNNTLPKIQDILGVQIVHGIINTIPTGILLKEDQLNEKATWPIVLQALDFPFIAKNLGHPVYDFIVQLQQEPNSIYPMPEINFGVPQEKHLGYALQWFIFATLVLVYYILNSFKRGID